MTARPLGPAILVDGDTLPTLRWCVALAVREKRRNGTRPGPVLERCHETAMNLRATHRIGVWAGVAYDTNGRPVRTPKENYR